MEQLSRRHFLRGAGATLGVALLSGCGIENLDNLATPESTVPGGINGGAEANTPAVRVGNAHQVTDTIPPNLCCQPGIFVQKANVDFPGVAPNYDDGPSPYNTEPILRALEKHNARGTFYIIGVNAIAWPEIVQRIIDAGHELGNHSYSHWPYIAYDLAQQIPQNQRLIKDMFNYDMVSNRTPGLTRGQIILDTCAVNGLYEVHTTIDSQDWKSPRISEQSIYNNVINPIHWGAIPLQHDGGNLRPTRNVQDAIFAELIKRGYILMPVTELLSSGEPNPGTPYYSNVVNLGDFRQSIDSEPETTQLDENTESIGEVVQFGKPCNYDPKAEMLLRLSQLDDKGILNNSERKEYNNINDALKEIPEAA